MACLKHLHSVQRSTCVFQDIKLHRRQAIETKENTKACQNISRLSEGADIVEAGEVHALRTRVLAVEKCVAEMDARVRGCEAHAIRADPAAFALRYVRMFAFFWGVEREDVCNGGVRGPGAGVRLLSIRNERARQTKSGRFPIAPHRGIAWRCILTTYETFRQPLL